MGLHRAGDVARTGREEDAGFSADEQTAGHRLAVDIACEVLVNVVIRQEARRHVFLVMQ